MKKVLLFVFLLIGILSQAQRAYKLNDAEKKFSKDSLQSLYFNELFAGDINEVFDVSPDLFVDEWSRFVNGIGRYLNREHFVWGKATRGDLEVYFNAAGKIDLLFISTRDNELSSAQNANLLALLEKFILDYQFKIIPKKAFSNSGSFQFTE